MADRPDQTLTEYLADRDVPCPECGYSLQGTSGDVCPECGERPDPKAIRAPRRGWLFRTPSPRERLIVASVGFALFGTSLAIAADSAKEMRWAWGSGAIALMCGAIASLVPNRERVGRKKTCAASAYWWMCVDAAFGFGFFLGAAGLLGLLMRVYVALFE